MSSTTSIGILVEAQDRATAQLKKIEQQLESMAKSMEETSKKSDGFGASLKKLAKDVSALFGTWKAFDFLKTSVSQFQQAESAMSRLAFITNNATGATQEMVQELFEQAKALELVGVLDATTIMNGQAKLATFDLQTKAIKELTPALLNLVVGEYGLKASSEQVANTANGLGKALQGNVELFTRQGFIVSEAQKEMLQYGDESERVATINEILGQTYDDLNERMAETAEGRLVNMTNRFNSLKEEIGRQLTPTINMLIGEMNNLFGMAESNDNGMQTFGQTIYRITNFVIGMAKSVQLLIQFLTALGDILIGAVFNSLKSTFSSIGKVFKGDFKGALEDLSNGSTEGGEKIVEKTKAWVEVLSEQFDSIGESAVKAFDLKGFDTSFNFFGKKGLQGDIGGVIDDKAVKEVKEKLGDIGKAYTDFAETADDALFNIRQSHKEKMASIKEAISGVRAEMRALSAEYEKTKQSNIQTVAQKIIAEEAKMAEMEKELQGDVSQSRYNELQAELQKKKDAMTQNSDFLASIEGALNEARRVAGLTELEKAIEDFNTRKAIAEEEFNTKMANLNNEMRALRQKRKDEDELYKQKRDFIMSMEKEVAEHYKKFTADNLNMTKDAILKEIEYYKLLADAIKASRNGNSAEVSRVAGKVTKVNDAIITPQGIVKTHPDDFIIATKRPQDIGGGKGSVTVNINGGMYLDQNSARKIGDEIIKALELQFKY